MEKQNENTNPNSIQDDEPFPELTQEQIVKTNTFQIKIIY